MASEEKSRDAFQPNKRYAAVGMQLGRVLVDDDFNEAERIRLEHERRVNLDVIGPVGSPDDGFLIGNGRLTGGRVDFDIEAGTLYLGGLRLWNPETVAFSLQDDWLEQLATDRPAFELGRTDLVYVEAWQQPVTAVEDSELLEVALGGADTSTRLRTMWRVRIIADVEGDDCPDAWAQVKAKWADAGLGALDDTGERQVDATLTVSYGGGVAGDLCAPAIAGGYLGAENQTLRVELRDADHFTWGFDNGAPLYRAQVAPDGTTVTLETDPRDQAHWPVSGQIVEILPWSAVLENGEKIAGTTGHLARVATSYDPDTRALGLDGAHALPAGFGQAWKIRADAADLGSGYVFVRVWDRGDDHTSPLAIPIAPAPVKLGSTGIQVSIAGTARVAGDHWIIAARPETPNQVVPWSLEDGRGVHGVRRWFAPLALIQWKLGNPDIPLPGPVEGKRVGLELLHDCRPVFAPLTELFGDCAVVVKPGPLWWSRIQRYVAAAEHVHLCFAPGVYPIDKPLVIADKASVKITGAGPGTLLTASGETALQLLRCKSVIVRDLAASAAKVLSGPVQGRPRINGALTITDCARVEVTGVTASCGSGLVRSAACVAINHLLNQEVIPHPAVRVSGCDFRPGDGQIGLIVLNPSRATIADNTVAVNPDAVAPSIGTVLSALPLRASLEVSLLSGIQFRDPDSPDSPDASVDGPTHLVDPSQPIGDGAIKMPITGRVVAWFYSDVSAKVWKLAIGIRPFPSNQEPTHRDVRRYLRKMARDIVLGHGRLDGHNISEAINWFALATESLRPAAAQGIVVAGMGAEDVRVTGNTVRDATQGIHVGVSHVSTDPEHPYDRISRVFVDRNQIDLVIRADRVRERHGVFVGNADNATIGDNQVFVARVGLGVVQYLEGVRLYGLLGPKAVIRDNYLSWFRVGVRFMISEAYYQSSPMWRVANNYCPYSTMAVVVNSKKIKLNGNHS